MNNMKCSLMFEVAQQDGGAHSSHDDCDSVSTLSLVYMMVGILIMLYIWLLPVAEPFLFLAARSIVINYT